MEFIAARIVEGRPRRIVFEGRRTMVVPVMMIQPGVYTSVENGRESHHLLPLETIESAVHRWESMPVALGHPQRSGRHVSARSPEVWETEVVGRLHHVRMDGQRLRADAYIDLEKVDRLGGEAEEIVQAIEAGEVLEVSVGFGGPTREESGIYSGRRYTSVLTEMNPDHLGIILHGEGQCSVIDGCGMNRVAQKRTCQCGTCNDAKGGNEPMNETKRVALKASQITIAAQADVSHDEIARLLEGAMVDQTGDGMSFLIVDRRDDTFVYHPALPKQNGEFQGWDMSQFFRRAYTIDDDRNVELGPEEQVIKEETFRPITASADPGTTQRASMSETVKHLAISLKAYFAKGSDENMDREKTIKTLSENQTCVYSKETLEKMTDDELTATAKQYEEPATPPTEPTEPAADPAQATLQSLDTQLKALSSGLENLDERISQGVKTHLEADEKTDLVASLKEHTEVDEAELSKLNLETLQRMAKAVVPATYQGRPMPRTHGKEPAETPVQYNKGGIVLERIDGGKTGGKEETA